MPWPSRASTSASRLLRVQAGERDLLDRRLAPQPREQVEQLVAELLAESRIVATTSSFTGSGSCSMCASSSTVDASAHCRSSRISTTGCSRATNASSRVTAANSR